MDTKNLFIMALLTISFSRLSHQMTDQGEIETKEDFEQFKKDVPIVLIPYYQGKCPIPEFIEETNLVEDCVRTLTYNSTNVRETICSCVRLFGQALKTHCPDLYDKKNDVCSNYSTKTGASSKMSISTVFLSTMSIIGTFMFKQFP